MNEAVLGVLDCRANGLVPESGALLACDYG